MEDNSNNFQKKPSKPLNLNRAIDEKKDVILKFNIDDTNSKAKTPDSASSKERNAKNKQNGFPRTDQETQNFSKFENLAKQKFLESLSSNTMKKKTSTKNLSANISSHNNPDENENIKLLKSKSNDMNNLENENYTLKNKILIKNNRSHSDHNRGYDLSSFDFWKTVDRVKEKCIELKNNENFRSCINPFRHDQDPTMRYVYYCLSATSALILFLLLYFILSMK